MEIVVRGGDMLREPADLAVLVSFEGAELPAEVAGLIEPADFSGRAKQSLLVYPRGAVAPRRLLLLGLGKADAVTLDAVRQAGALATQKARELQGVAVSIG